MSRIVGDTGTAIADRFFYAIEELRCRRVIRGLASFARRHNINTGNLNNMKNNREKHSVKTEYLSWLAQDYGVSCEWLLLGNGDMFVEGSPAVQGQ